MGKFLISENFRKYFEIITSPDLMDDEKMIKIIGDALSIIADDVCIGRADAMKTLPRRAFNHDSKLEQEILFQSEKGYDDRPVVKKYEVGDRSKVIIHIFPAKGHEWDETELEEIDIIFNCTFVFMSRSRLVRTMNRIAITDSQTNMPNYMAVCEWTGKRLVNNELKNYTCVFINIKNFKYVNKVGSSKCGDICLYNYGHILMDAVEEDGIVGRLGGDNFVAFVKNEKIEDFIKKVSVVKINCELPMRTFTFNIESRMGIHGVKEGENISDAMNRASIAQKVARTNYSENVIWFEERMLKKLYYAKEVSADFQRALVDKEFVVYYQPKVNIMEKTICGCEALTRWMKNGKLIPPLDFIPVLEEEGTICQLDFYVLDMVCKDIKAWLAKGIEPVRVSVNFSTLHLYDKDLVKKIIDVINKNQVDTKYIEIELTEMSGYDDYEILSNFVMKMKEYGIYTSIDDFGTGYSSMNLLRTINVEQIKLDKSFFREDDIAKHKIMIRNVVNMINELGMSALAEGIETKEQEEFLKAVSCNVVQGYLYDKPLPKDVFVERLMNRDYYQE